MVVQNALYSFKELKKSLFSIVIHIPWIYLEAFVGKLLACPEAPRPPGLASEAVSARPCLKHVASCKWVKRGGLSFLIFNERIWFKSPAGAYTLHHFSRVKTRPCICKPKYLFSPGIFKNHEVSIRGLVCYKYNNKFIPFHSSLDCETVMWLWFFMTGIPRFITILSLYYCDIPCPPIICNSVF